MTQNELLRIIDRRREELGVTIEELSERKAVSPGTYANWISGAHSPNLDKLLRLMSVLGLTLAVSRHDNRNPCINCYVKEVCSVTCSDRKNYDQRWKEAHQ